MPETMPLLGFIVSRRFGLAHCSAIFGSLGVGGALATSLSFVFFGKVHDLTGSYDLALAVGAGAFCVGALAFAIGSRRGSGEPSWPAASRLP